jgi:uncharacterized repeat protein (TIGR01451 family)
MITRTSLGLRAALVAAAAFGWWTSASAQLTPADTPILNRATVNYTVGGVAQDVIESSPTGNTTPGAGAGVDTEFRVDNLVDLTLSEASGTATVTSPGAVGAALGFTVTNTGNAPQGYQLTLSEDVGTTLAFGPADNEDIGLANLVIRVDGNGNGTYDVADTATQIDVLNPDTTIAVFIVAAPSVPLTLANASFANVRLQAQTAVPNTNGATLQAETVGVNNPLLVEVVFADDGEDATENAADQFEIRSAALLITKTQSVIDDGFSASDPRAIPGAIVEYLIEIENTSATTDADAVSIEDLVPANTTFLATQAVVITGGVVATCTGDNNDADTDGCGVAGGELTVGPGVIGSVGAGDTVTVAFQVTID